VVNNEEKEEEELTDVIINPISYYVMKKYFAI